MAKDRVLLADLPALTKAPEATSNVVTLQRDDVEPRPQKSVRHTSLYLSEPVKRAIKEIAFQFDRKPHDLYIEGIDLMLIKYGKPTSKELSGE